MVKKGEIAVALGVSASAVTKYVRRGMPTSSIAAARVWCDTHLDPVRRVAQQMGMSAKRGGAAGEPSASELVARANEFGRLATIDYERHSSALRLAMREVPRHARELVRLSSEVWLRMMDWDNFQRWNRFIAKCDEIYGPLRLPVDTRSAQQVEDDDADLLWQMALGDYGLAKITDAEITKAFAERAA
jgi:hypothetical protein